MHFRSNDLKCTDKAFAIDPNHSHQRPDSAVHRSRCRKLRWNAGDLQHVQIAMTPAPSANCRPDRLASAAPELSLAWKRAEGHICACVSLLIFSGWFVVTRFSVTRNLQICDITALHFGVGALLFAPVLLRHKSRLPPAAWREGFLFALLWVT